MAARMFSAGGGTYSVRPTKSRLAAFGKACLDVQVHNKVRAPWQRARGVDAVVEKWLHSRVVKPCFTADETKPSKEAVIAPFPPGLPTPIAFALRGRGVTDLYDHQAKAFTAARSGKRGVVVATPTASGKSYCFHLPVLASLLEDPDARALYLYPTKALSRDQEASLRELMKASGVATGAVVYDGDTPGDARRAAREKSGVILTNPDMLHTGILPHHTAWARTFQNLKYVVVDELHTYKGVFGSHVANVLRRLMRVARFHGSQPVHHRRDRDDRKPRRARRADLRDRSRTSSRRSRRTARRRANAACSCSTRPS